MRVRALRRAGVFRPAVPMDDAVIHARAGAADRLEVRLVAGNLPQHERIVGVEAGGHQARRADVVRAQRTARARYEVCNAPLRLRPLVEVLVPRQHEADVVGDERRLEARPRPEPPDPIAAWRIYPPGED